MPFIFETNPAFLYLFLYATTYMLQFKQSDTAAVLTLTLTEKVTVTDPYFLFVFTHVLTKQVVSFIKYSGDDESDYITRYNQYTINPSVVFDDKPIGEWHYKIYEQASSTNTDISLTGDILEYGKMRLDRATEFEFDMYNQQQSFTAYNG
jgi:hypothetical protein